MSYPPAPQNPQGYPGYPQQPGYPPPGYLPPGYGVPPGYPPPGGPGVPPLEKGRKKYNSLTAMFVFYLPDLWRDVGQRWWGIGLIYMFLLLLLTWLPAFIRGHAGVVKFVSDDAPKLTSQVPVVTIKQGAISIDRPEPYTITDPDNGQPIVVFDTSGETTEPPSNVPSMLVTKHTIVMRRTATQTQTTDLSQVQSFKMDGNDIQRWLQWLVSGWWPIWYPSMVVVDLIRRLILMLIFATIGLAFVSGTKAPLSYAGLLRLSAIAMTPVILIDTLIGFVPDLNPGCWWTIGGAVVDLLMLFLAVKANAPKMPAGFSGPQGFPVAPQSWPQPGGYPGPYAGNPPMPPPPQ